MVWTDIVAHYGHQLITFLFAAAVTAIIVMVIHRVFQPFLLSTLDEVRESTSLFKRLIHKDNLNNSERDLVGRLAIAYAVVSGLFFVGIMSLLSDLATPLG